MAWNISFMCVKAPREQIEKVIPDVLYKSEENLFFTDATSYRMDKAMGVTHLNDWIIISDVANRVTYNEEFPLDVSKEFEVKTYYISENPIYRHYAEGSSVETANGIDEFDAIIEKKGINPKDKYGETKSIQLFEREILNGLDNNGVNIYLVQNLINTN